tara:strand:+ start:1871 stop:2434 length:564 start_codon:yes stop_codon:yes gene_type:complete
MRIISGKIKGKKLILPPDKNTRPLKDLTKESIFNILGHSKKFKIKIHKSRILDLFSGVGSFGLECLSRDALNVTFIENYQKVIEILKKNIINTGFKDKSVLIEKDIFDHVNFKDFTEKFDLIFMDPPYKIENLNLLLEKINKTNILVDNGIIIIHRHKKENDNFVHNFNIIEEKSYGISKIIFGKFN